MRIPWPSLSEYGIIRDVKDFLLPPNAWTEGRGVRFQDNSIVRQTGHVEIFPGSPIDPYWLQHTFDIAGESHWMVAGLTNVYDYSSGAYHDITKAATTYNTDPTRLWNGGMIGNIPVINNGVEKPQMWAPVSAGQRLVDLTNWPATHTARVLRAFKDFLVALDITEGGVRFPQRIRISHPAEPGTIPDSWDDLDPTKLVYVNDISDFGAGNVLDAGPLGSILVVYKERATFVFQFVGGAEPWRKDDSFTESGILATGCFVPFAQGMQHFVLTGQDLIFHGGQQPTSILTKRGRRWLMANIDTTNYARSFCVHNTLEGECWACIPLIGSDRPNLAVVWNYREMTLSYRDLDQFSHIAGGVVEQSLIDDSWDSDDESWDSDTTSWDAFTHPPFIRRLVAAKPTTRKFFHLDVAYKSDQINYSSYVERTGLDIIGVSKTGQLVRNREVMRLIKRIYIQASGSPFNVWIQTQQDIEGPITWSLEGTFTPGVDKFVDVLKPSQLWGIRFESIGEGAFTISGFEPDIEPLGEFG